MTIRITDRNTGETYEANCIEDCDGFADKVGFVFVQAYGKPEIISNTVYELVEG